MTGKRDGQIDVDGEAAQALGRVEGARGAGMALSDYAISRRLPVRQFYDALVPLRKRGFLALSAGSAQIPFVAVRVLSTSTQTPAPSTQLHRGIAGSCVFLNYAVWESVAHVRAAFTHPDFQIALGAYPSSAMASPHLFSRVAHQRIRQIPCKKHLIEPRPKAQLATFKIACAMATWKAR